MNRTHTPACHEYILKRLYVNIITPNTYMSAWHAAARNIDYIVLFGLQYHNCPKREVRHSLRRVSARRRSIRTMSTASTTMMTSRVRCDALRAQSRYVCVRVRVRRAFKSRMAAPEGEACDGAGIFSSACAWMMAWITRRHARVRVVRRVKYGLCDSARVCSDDCRAHGGIEAVCVG